MSRPIGSRRQFAVIAAGIALTSVVFAQTLRAQDDWHVVERHNNGGHAEAVAPPAEKATSGLSVVCGEEARPAAEPYKSIVAQLNDMWGTNFQVYQSLQGGSPHAATGGCIFYNQKFLDGFLKNWMRIDDQDAVRPMLYAIFAHELGHLAHGDVDPASANVPVKNKELAADQFSGYSMERLGIRRLDPDEVTRYYQLTGDDFIGASSSHGSGEERTAAFQDGWHRAEVGLPEQSARPSGGLGEP